MAEYKTPSRRCIGIKPLIVLIAWLLAACTTSVHMATSPTPNLFSTPPGATTSAEKTRQITTSPSPSSTTSAPMASQTRVTHTRPTVTPTPDPVFEFHPPERLYCKQEGCIYNCSQLFQRPLPQEYDPQIEKTYRYGSTQNGNREMHTGVEFSAAVGTPVIASADGTVFYAGNDDSQAFGPITGFYGNLVLIEHHFIGMDDPIFTLYAHLSTIDVEYGEKVTVGQQIGAVGVTGTSSGAHLHFEVRIGGSKLSHTVNPEIWLAPSSADQKSEMGGTLVLKLAPQSGSIYSSSVLIQDFSDPLAASKPYIDAETYARSAPTDPFWNEILAVGDLPPGIYRISLTHQNKIYQKVVEIEIQRITLVEFEIE